MSRWRVWVTVYPGSYVDVDAASSRDAMQAGTRKLCGSWGDTIELNARELTHEPAPRGIGPTFTRIVRIGVQGAIESW